MSCKSIEIDYIDLARRREINELNGVIYSFRVANGRWPNSEEVTTFSKSNRYLMRFGNVVLTQVADSSLNVFFRMEFNDFDDPIRSLDMTQVLTLLPESGSYTIDFDVVDLVLQDTIPLGRRWRLTKNESKIYKQRERLRKQSRHLVIENTRTKDRLGIPVASHIYLFSKDTTLAFDDYTTRRGQKYQSLNEWILTTINLSDSTMNIDATDGILRRLVKFSEIDSMKVKSLRGTFKVIGVRDILRQ